MFKRFVCFSTKSASRRWNYPNFAKEDIRGKTSVEKFILKFARFCLLLIFCFCFFCGKSVTLRDVLFCLFQDLLRITVIDFVKTLVE